MLGKDPTMKSISGSQNLILKFSFRFSDYVEEKVTMQSGVVKCSKQFLDIIKHILENSTKI